MENKNSTFLKQKSLTSFFTTQPKNNIKPEQEEDHWIYYPKYLQEIKFEELYNEVFPLLTSYFYTSPEGKNYPSKRLSCILTTLIQEEEEEQKINSHSKLFGYDQIGNYDWSSSPLIQSIKEKIEVLLNEKYDYVLVHLYRDGKDIIGWHADRESMNSSVVSISFGASRKFEILLRTENEPKITKVLHHGDIFYMKDTMQQLYKHQVPKESNALFPRINLTIRKFQKIPEIISNNKRKKIECIIYDPFKIQQEKEQEEKEKK